MDVDPFIYEANNRPIDDFCGLSAAEMHQLVHNPTEREGIEPNSPICLISVIYENSFR